MLRLTCPIHGQYGNPWLIWEELDYANAMGNGFSRAETRRTRGFTTTVEFFFEVDQWGASRVAATARTSYWWALRNSAVAFCAAAAARLQQLRTSSNQQEEGCRHERSERGRTVDCHFPVATFLCLDSQRKVLLGLHRCQGYSRDAILRQCQGS
jgi:hypothetical protein